ncbi:MAG: hypothetical protein ACOY3P_11135, partial [Planctomycetota bacterium]
YSRLGVWNPVAACSLRRVTGRANLGGARARRGDRFARGTPQTLVNWSSPSRGPATGAAVAKPP